MIVPVAICDIVKLSDCIGGCENQELVTGTLLVFTCSDLKYLLFQGEGMGVNPLYLMVPVAICCSFAFMLPVATPPNAIVFAYGNVRIIDMVRSLSSGY